VPSWDRNCCRTLPRLMRWVEVLNWNSQNRERWRVRGGDPKTALQYIATHCNTLQHTATHCNTLQHTLLLSLSSLGFYVRGNCRSGEKIWTKTFTYEKRLQGRKGDENEREREGERDGERDGGGERRRDRKNICRELYIPKQTCVEIADVRRKLRKMPTLI